MSIVVLLGAQEVRADQIAHWTFDATSGTVADELVASQHGTLHGFPGDGSEWVEGVLGNALQFDGIDDYVSHPVAMPQQAGTLGHWLMTYDQELRVAVYESDAPDGATDYNGFGAAGDALENHSGATSVWQYRLQDGELATNGRFVVAGGSVDPDRWTHVAITWDRAADLVLYINCLEVDRVSLAGGTFSNHGVNESFFGRPSEATRFWRGRIDDIRMYDHSMGASELRDTFCRLQEETSVLTPEPLPSHGRFGTSLALDGDRLVVGDSAERDGARGRLHLYRRDGRGGLIPDGELLGPPPGSPASIGHNAAIDGDTIVTALYQTNTPGEILIYQDQGDGTWATQTLEPPIGAGVSFGRRLEISGDWLAVADYGNTNGVVFLYRRDELGTWALSGSLAGSEVSGAFGSVIALELPYLAVAEPNFSQQAGRVAVYEIVGNSVVYRFEILGSPQTLTATSLAIEPPLLVVGVILEGALLSSGLVRVYDLPSGAEIATLQAPDFEAKDYFGLAVALSGDDIAVLANPLLLNAADRPGVYLFRRTVDEWRFLRRLKPSTWNRSNEFFGTSLAVSSTEVVVTAPRREIGGVMIGAAFVFPTPIFEDGFESGDSAAWSSAPR